MGSARLFAFALLAAVAACGKMGPPEEPPGSTWPKGYPTGSLSKPVTGLPSSGMTAPVTSTANESQPVAAGQPAFTKSGAWIDPNLRRPTIDSNADRDKYELNN